VAPFHHARVTSGLAHLFAAGPEPERSAARAERVIESAQRADAARLARQRAERPEGLARVLRALCATAPFFAATLVREPELLFALAEGDLAQPRTFDEMCAALDAALAGAASAEVGAILRRFKYAELARITVRDAEPALVPEARVEEPLRELSALAESVLSRAFARVAADFAAELGAPRWRTAQGGEIAPRFVVLGLGKLGGEELNYSSDVDLIYVYESPPPEAEPLSGGPRELAPADYYAQLARRFGKLMAERGPEGFLYRVDLDLRPEGTMSPLVPSSGRLLLYYDGYAATWERAAFMKARPVAGDLAFGWSLARQIDPMIYQSKIDFAGVDSIREMKTRIEREHANAEADIKLGAGGIRDVEFVAQALQLLHGARAPQVRGRSAPRALVSLAEAKCIPEAMRDELLDAYRFLRRVENRLQMEDERQTHTLPAGSAARERLARTLYSGDAALAQFDARLDAVRSAVRARFEALVQRPGGGAHLLGHLREKAPRLFAAPRMADQLSALADRVAAEIAASPDPPRATNNWMRFVEGIGGRSFYFGLLLDRPELVARLVSMFAMSRFLSDVIARVPGLIEPIFSDPTRFLSTREQLAVELAELREQQSRGDAANEEAALAAMRLFQQRQLVNIGLLDLSGKIPQAEVERALTDVAEVCIGAALEVARAQLARVARAHAQIERGEFLVVGMGKLGSRELGYGSDLDVIFLFDLPGAPDDEAVLAQEAFVRLAQKFSWALQKRTGEGICYEVDAQLRPSGNQGVLVTSLAGFARHHETQAQLWERQALLRARPVGGSTALAARFEALRARLLARELPANAASEIDRVRRRVESELANENAQKRNLKLGRGSIFDVETIVQLLALQHGGDLHEVATTAAVIERCAARSLLTAEQAKSLRDGWSFLARLASRLRIVENRSIADLGADRADLDSVARSLGYAPSARTGTSRVPLLDDYARHTEAIRRVYDEVVRGA